jgi:hypothetical protein
VTADRQLVAQLAVAADRLDDLADLAELMGDEAGAVRFRNEGSRCRRRAMTLLDPDPRPGPGQP